MKFQTLNLIQQPKPFNHPEWIFEVKYDGFRSLAYIQSGCTLVSRNGNIFSRFKDLSQHLSRFPLNAVLDGEVVCLDDEGKTLFNDLMFNRAVTYFYAFDLLWLDGIDMRNLPLLQRKKALRDLIEGQPLNRLSYVDYVVERGEQLYEMIYAKDMEGIVAKPQQSQYQLLAGGKTPWIKIKNPDYSQAKGRNNVFSQPR